MQQLVKVDRKQPKNFLFSGYRLMTNQSPTHWMIQLGIASVKILEEVPASSASFSQSCIWWSIQNSLPLQEDVVNYWLTDRHLLVKDMAWPQYRVSKVCWADELPLRVLPGLRLDQMKSSGLGAAKTHLAKSPPFFSSAGIQLMWFRKEICESERKFIACI